MAGDWLCSVGVVSRLPRLRNLTLPRILLYLISDTYFCAFRPQQRLVLIFLRFVSFLFLLFACRPLDFGCSWYIGRIYLVHKYADSTWIFLSEVVRGASVTLRTLSCYFIYLFTVVLEVFSSFRDSAICPVTTTGFWRWVNVRTTTTKTSALIGTTHVAYNNW